MESWEALAVARLSPGEDVGVDPLLPPSIAVRPVLEAELAELRRLSL